MSEQQYSLKSLKNRKSELMAEAEVQRERLQRDLDIVRNGIDHMREQAKSAGSFASTAVLILAGLSALRAVFRLGRDKSPPFLARLAFGARLASTVWLALSSRRRVSGPTN